MNAKRTDANWVTIDPSSLPDQTRAAYENYKTAYRMMKEQREAFEALMQAGVPEGQRVVCGYNFGKLSLAIVPNDRKPAKSKIATQSLAEFLASQAANGKRA